MHTIATLIRRLLCRVRSKPAHPGRGTATVVAGGATPLAGKFEVQFEILALQNARRHELGLPPVTMTPRRWAMLSHVRAARDRQLEAIELRPLRP